MKFKVLVFAALLTLGISAVSYAAVGTTAWRPRATDGSVTIPTTVAGLPALTIKPSANVFMAWGVETTGVSYTIGTIHTSGTFTYATSSTETNIYRFSNASQASTSNTTYSGSAQLPPDSPLGATGLVTWGAGWTASK